MRHYCVNITIDLVFELYTPVFTVGMNWRRILISRRFYFQPSLLVINIPVYLYSPRLRRRFRRSILTAVMRPPFLYVWIRCYERFGFIVMRDLDSLLWEIWIHCYERFGFIVMRDLCVNVTRYLVFESHTSRLYLPSVWIDGGLFYSLDNLVYNLPYWSYTSPSIFTLHDFVVAFAGLFLRRLCDLPFYTFGFVVMRDLDSLLWEITVSTLR